MQRQLHAAQGEISAFQRLAGAEGFNGFAVPGIVRENLIHVGAHTLRQNIPGLAVLCKKIGQLELRTRLQIPGAAGEGRGKLFLPEADAGNGQRAEILFTCAVVDRINVQRTAALALLAGIKL